MAGLASVALLILVAVFIGVSLLSAARQSPSPSATLSPTELKYRLLENFGPPLYCDRDFYPIGRDEQQAALAQFPAIAQDSEAFPVILRKNNLDPGSAFSAQQKLTIYRDYKKLQATTLESGQAKHRFSLTVAGAGNRFAGTRIDGFIDRGGTIEVQSRTPTAVNCPICLGAGTRIDTPSGPIAVKDLREGMAVWTADSGGARHPAMVLKTGHTPVPTAHQMVALVLSDGRQLRASPGHPTTDGRAIGDLKPGDPLDGAHVVSADRVRYGEEATYDLLPSGETGWYWADGVLLASTLR